MKYSSTKHMHVVPKHSNIILQIISKAISFVDSGDKKCFLNLLQQRMVATDFNSSSLSYNPQIYVRSMDDALKWQHWAKYGASWKKHAHSFVENSVLLLFLFLFYSSCAWSGVVWWTLNSPQKGPALWKSFPCHEVIGIIVANFVVNCIVVSCELLYLCP